MPSLFVLCGSPGSGKTTLSKKLAEEHDATRYSFDEMRCFSHNELFPHVLGSLLRCENVVVDALFTREVWRKTLLETVQDLNCKRILIRMTTPLEECIRRNAQRPNPLPEFVVRDIYNHIELPTLSEGWDDIWYYT